MVMNHRIAFSIDGGATRDDICPFDSDNCLQKADNLRVDGDFSV